MGPVNRREFLLSSALLLTPPAGKRAFGVTNRGGRSWFSAPDGKPFFSLGFNHIDWSPMPAELWRRKYKNSTDLWLDRSVRPDLLDWGFNSLGWSQEVVIRGDTIHRHSPPFTYEQYQKLGLPYCHMLPFSEVHQWDMEVRHPDFFGKDFEDWCDYVARSHCTRLADDPKLVGYFYSDCPMWVHDRPANHWKGPLFDAAKLATKEGRTELRHLATRYYQVTRDAIRRYDARHLILGDRYEAKAPLPDEVLLAAQPFVDVFSFQHFGAVEQIRADLTRFSQLTGKPVLLADSAGMTPQPDGVIRNDPGKYRETLAALREIPGCVGYHLCGAYLRNTARKRGLRGPDETPDREAIDGIRAANRDMQTWISATSR